MINYISGLIFVVLLVIGGAVSFTAGTSNIAVGIIIGFFWLLGDIILSSGVQLAAQWEKEEAGVAKITGQEARANKSAIGLTVDAWEGPLYK